MTDVEHLCAKAIATHRNLLVPWYLMASYAYYHLDSPLISDEAYDSICKQLLEAIDNLEIDHMHAYLCDVESLKAGTAFNLKKKDYPSRVVSVVHGLLNGRLG